LSTFHLEKNTSTNHHCLTDASICFNLSPFYGPTFVNAFPRTLILYTAMSSVEHRRHHDTTAINQSVSYSTGCYMDGSDCKPLSNDSQHILSHQRARISHR